MDGTTCGIWRTPADVVAFRLNVIVALIRQCKHKKTRLEIPESTYVEVPLTWRATINPA